MKTLSEIKIGKTFKVGNTEFIKLDEHDGEAVAITKDCICRSNYGANNDFSKSEILEMLKSDFLVKIENEIGAENVKDFELDLISFDGLDTYGKITTKVGLITLDMYRKYVRIFDKDKLNCWWWLATADSTPEHANDRWLLCVSPDGGIGNGIYYGNYIGVRPFLHFVSSISVS